ncbi:hypothetical protein I5677_05745 [Mobilitalea sibirica]|uniref:Transglutaminase-like domain-containing protein n=1 Tax=Mobilitalea sibirica TaxID=1462919 RepID=A0A8J7HD28_9FIRM|nr:transglutaminase domain-containing protein [Mobilitalea sibirica]MBH1940399.1 hypothetical protein [Mobilitalea sibirica]
MRYKNHLGNRSHNKGYVFIIIFLILIALSSCSRINTKLTDDSDTAQTEITADTVMVINQTDDTLGKDNTILDASKDKIADTEPENQADNQPSPALIKIQEPSPIPEPTERPNAVTIPTPEPSIKPTVTPTPKPTIPPSPIPTPKPTIKPTPVPISKPSVTPSAIPTPKPVRELPSKGTKDVKEYAEIILQAIITEDMKEVEKVKAVHDYIVRNTAYDYDNLKANTIPEESYKIEGVLFHNTAVCQGYADTFQLFMELLEIESKVVVGKDLKNGVGHAWNMVELDGQWYQIDVTWDDPVPDQEGIVQYQYFLVTDEVMAADHSWNKKNYPKCNSETYLYYIYEDYIVESIDDVEEEFMEQYNSGKRTITLLYPEEGIPDMNFLGKYDYLFQDTDDEYITYTYYEPWRKGDYTVFVVMMD